MIRGIRFKLFLPIAIAFAILVAGMHFLWLPEMIDDKRDSVIEREDYVLRAIGPGLTRALLVNDLGAIHATLNYQLKLNKDSWRQIVFSNTKGKRLYPLLNPRTLKGEFLIEIKRNVVWDKHSLGVMRLLVDWEKEYQQQLQHVHRLEWMAFIVFFISVVGAAIWQNRLILLPISNLETAVSQLVKGGQESIFPKAQKDEIGDLTKAFSQMRADLKKSQYKLKQTIKKVKESETRQRNIVENMSNGLITADGNGDIQSVNPAAEKIFGYRENEIIGHNLKTLLPDLECSSQQNQPHANFESKIIRVGNELTGRRQDDILFPVEFAQSKIILSGKKVFLCILTDVTERKLAELELTQAKEEAVKANKAKTDFLSRMSHELRTPMNAILGFSQLLEMDKDRLDEEQKDGVKEISSAGRHLSNLINDVLDFARIETGKMVVSIAPVFLDDVINQVNALIENLAAEHHIKVINNIRNKGYIVSADFTRLQQVLMNFLTNAVKYNNEEGTVTLDAVTMENDWLRISVSDTGNGLNEEELHRLFLPFDRINTLENIEGTGIGLVITKNLVKLMGGRIGVESTKGEGSQFWVEFKLVKAESVTATAS